MEEAEKFMGVFDECRPRMQNGLLEHCQKLDF
jgi:hypothetical protein